MNYGFMFLFVVQKGVCIGLSLFLNYPYTTITTPPPPPTLTQDNRENAVLHEV